MGAATIAAGAARQRHCVAIVIAGGGKQELRLGREAAFHGLQDRCPLLVHGVCACLLFRLLSGLLSTLGIILLDIVLGLLSVLWLILLSVPSLS